MKSCQHLEYPDPNSSAAMRNKISIGWIGILAVDAGYENYFAVV